MNWRLAGASVAGAAHVRAGTACQDAHRIEVIAVGDGRTIIALIAADGAGSAKEGGTGAALAASSLRDQAVAWFRSGGTVRDMKHPLVQEWLDGVREVISVEAGASHSEMRDFAATLLFAFMDGERAAFGQIGDGAMVVCDGAGDWEVMFWPQRGDYANQTFFVTDPTAKKQLRFAHAVHSIREIAVFTDGMERLLLDFESQRAHTPVFEKMLAPLRNSAEVGFNPELSGSLGQYLGSQGVASRTDDDVTLLIATCRERPAPAAGRI